MFVFIGTSVLQVTATDADDANYGNSAKVVYSILQGQPYFSVDPESGNNINDLFHFMQYLWMYDELISGFYLAFCLFSTVIP